MDVTETMDPMDCNLSESSSSPPSDVFEAHMSALKRTASDAGLKPDGTRPTKSVKRRAAKACQCCRNRKVRCNVVEHGAPCTNCRLDEVECIVSESKRKKYVSIGSSAKLP
jgi:NAD-dependent SIR2 family protein deacetylase